MINEFIELSPFTRAAEKLLGPDGLRMLQMALMENAEAGDLIPAVAGCASCAWLCQAGARAVERG